VDHPLVQVPVGDAFIHQLRGTGGTVSQLYRRNSQSAVQEEQSISCTGGTVSQLVGGAVLTISL
jgi:hypothetical protein